MHPKSPQHISQHRNQIISLSKWPTQPFIPNQKNLSPSTYRILKLSKVNIKQIVPLTLKDFIKANNDLSKPYLQIQDQYSQQKQRRKKKVQILTQLWKKFKSKSKGRSSSVRKVSIYRKKNHTYYSSTNLPSNGPQYQTCNHQKPQKSSSKYFSTYSDYYASSKGLTARQKKTFCDQSTRSRRETHQYQIDNVKKGEKDIKNQKMNKKTQPPPKFSAKTLHQLNKVMENWSDLEQRQTIQVQYLSQHPEITDREKKRLIKIHQIEKHQIKHQIEALKQELDYFKRVKHQLKIAISSQHTY